MRAKRGVPLLIAALLFVPSRGTTQELLVGGQLGASWSTFDAGQGLDGYRTGIFGGMMASYGLGRTLRIESGVRWIEKGAEGDLQGFEEPISASQSLSYLQIPLLMRLSFFPDGRLRPSVAAGPSVSFEVRCRFEQEGGTLAHLVGCDESERVGTDVGLLFGAGLAWRVGRAELLLEGLYDLGLRDIGSVDALGTHNRGLVLAPRLSVPLGGRAAG